MNSAAAQTEVNASIMPAPSESSAKPTSTAGADPLYNSIRKAMKAGLEVSLRPSKNKTVKLTVQEAKNGIVNGCDVELNPFEWSLCGEGISNRIEEALKILK